jgi:hypothetical protein
MSRGPLEYLSRQHYFVRNYSHFKCLSCGIVDDHQSYFRRISTASRQEFHRVLHRESADFQRLFHTICTRNGHRKNGRFFIAFFGAFPKALAGSADEKNGEKKAVMTMLRKNGLRSAVVARLRGFQHHAHTSQ